MEKGWRNVQSESGNNISLTFRCSIGNIFICLIIIVRLCSASSGPHLHRTASPSDLFSGCYRMLVSLLHLGTDARVAAASASDLFSGMAKERRNVQSASGNNMSLTFRCSIGINFICFIVIVRLFSPLSGPHLHRAMIVLDVVC